MHKKIFSNSVFMITMIFIGKFLGLLRESMLARQYGAGFVTDTFIFSWGMVAVLFSAIGNALTTTLLPMLMEKKNKGEDINYFINNVVNIVICILLIMTIVLIIFSKQIIEVFAPGLLSQYTVIQMEQSIQAVRIAFLSLIFIGMQNIFLAIHSFYKEYRWQSFSSIVLNLILIGYMLIFKDKFGMIGLEISLLLAFIGQFAALIPFVRKKGYRYKFVINFKDREMKKMYRLMIPVILGSTINQINFTIDKMLASLVMIGGISIMNFANKLSLVIYGVFSAIISSIIYSELAELSLSDKAYFEKFIINCLKNIILWILPIITILISLSKPVTELIFYGGNYTIEMIEITNGVFIILMPTLLGYLIRDVVVRVFYSLKHTKIPAVNTGIGVGINIIINILLYKSLGLYGLAIGTLISTFVTCILLLISMKKRLSINCSVLKSSFVKALITAIGAMILSRFTYVYFINKLHGNFISIILSGGLGMLCYIIIICIWGEIKIKDILNYKRFNK